MMDFISSLHTVGDSLWIGYGSATGGGLGQLDLRSQKLISFMPSLNANSSSSPDETPPRDGIGNIITIKDGDLWMFVNGAIREYHVARDSWGTLPNTNGSSLFCFSADSERLVRGVNVRQIDKSGSISFKGKLEIQSLHDSHWQSLEDAEKIPNPPTTMTLDGSDLWVGGEGYIALVDLKECKVRRFCHIQTSTVDRIEIAGGFVWAQYDSHLYRVPIGDTRHEFLQSNFAKFVPVQFQKDTNGTAVLQRLHVSENMFEHNGMYYCGFKFAVPAWFDGNYRLMYILAKTEAQRDFTAKFMNSDIISENGPAAGSNDYLRESLASYPQLQTQFPYTTTLTTQNMDMKQLEPGKTYGIWFEFDDKNMPDIAFAMTVNSQHGTNEFGILPLR
jgi:hypothetical protein